jgi:hypothetical protein
VFELFRDLAPDLKLAGYRQRCEKAVATLAGVCGNDEQQELERFRWCHQRLGHEEDAPPPSLADGATMLEQLAALTCQGLPLLFEFLLSYSGRGAPRFSYLTQGQPAGSLTQSLGALLEGLLTMHLESHGDPEVGDLLARQFRIAFPGLSTLDDFSPTAQAMLVGVVPAAEQTRLKLYFNTRLDTSSPHRKRVLALLESCGLADDGLYDVLYGDTDRAYFHGVGVDVAGGRAKLYVHVHRDRLDDALDRLARHLSHNGTLEAQIREPAKALMATLDSEALLDRVEVAVSLRRSGDTTAKVTAFLSPRRAKDEDVERVVAYVESHGHDAAPLRAAVRSLRQGVDQPARQRQPVRGVGIETPTRGRTKVNVYLQATM